MNSKKIYILTSVMPVENAHPSFEDAHEYDVDVNGAIRVFRRRAGAFSSVEKAEAAIKRLISENEFRSSWGWWTKYACFILEELALDNGVDEEGTIFEFESKRLYLGNGELAYFSDCDERCDKEFAGGDDTQKYVKNGDFAYFLSDDKLIPILVDKAAFSKDEWKARFKEGAVGDFTDDSGLAFSADGTCADHFHPLWVHVLPTSVVEGDQIPKHAKTKCREERDAYYGELDMV